MTRLVAIAPNVPEAKILLQKNAAKQAGFAGFVVKMRHRPGAVNRKARIESLGSAFHCAQITPWSGLSEWRDQRRRDRLPGSNCAE